MRQVLASLCVCRDTFRPPARLDRRRKTACLARKLCSSLRLQFVSHVCRARICIPGRDPSSATAQDGRGFFFRSQQVSGFARSRLHPHPGVARRGWSAGRRWRGWRRWRRGMMHASYDHNRRYSVLENQLLLVIRFEHKRIFIKTLDTTREFHSAQEIDGNYPLFFTRIV